MYVFKQFNNFQVLFLEEFELTAIYWASGLGRGFYVSFKIFAKGLSRGKIGNWG